MIWLWRICFSGFGALPLLAGTVSGRVELADSRETAVRKHKDYSGVVVWLEPVDGQPLLAGLLRPAEKACAGQ